MSAIVCRPQDGRSKCVDQGIVEHHQSCRLENAVQQIRTSECGLSHCRQCAVNREHSCFVQVAGVKIVTSARSPMSKCFGYVTMNSTEEASACIENLHRTELHGKMISLEHVRVMLSISIMVSNFLCSDFAPFRRK